MNNKPGLFMGWSGDLSKEIALSLKKMFNSIFRGSIEVFFTEEDIDPGKLWNNDLNQKLYKCDIGILVCTPQNLDSLWMAYEAGAISNRIGQGRVIPLVFGANITDLKGPLKQFQAKRFAVEGIMQTLESINASLGNIITDKDLRENLYYIWPLLENNVKEMLEKHKELNEGIKRNIKSTNEILDDIYSLIQASSSPVLIKNIQDLVGEIKPLVQQVKTTRSGHYLFIDGEDPAFSALIAATERAKDYIRSTRLSPMSISGNQDAYGDAIRSRVIGLKGYSPVKQYTRIIAANHPTKLADIEKYLQEFRGCNFDLYLTKKSNSFELVIIDTHEVFIHFHGPKQVIKSTLHIVGTEVARHFIEIYDRLHDPKYDPDVFKIGFAYMGREDVDQCRKRIEDFFAEEMAAIPAALEILAR